MTSDLGRTDVKIGKDYGGYSTIGPMYDRPPVPSSNDDLIDRVRAFTDALDLKTIRHRELKLSRPDGPSKGYLFANLDHIRKNVYMTHNPIDFTYTYLYLDKKNGLTNVHDSRTLLLNSLNTMTKLL